MIVKIGDNEYEAICNGLTPIAYSRCFSVVNDFGVKRPKDINEADGGSEVSRQVRRLGGGVSGRCIRFGAFGRLGFRRDGSRGGELFSARAKGRGAHGRLTTLFLIFLTSWTMRAMRSICISASNAACR